MFTNEMNWINIICVFYQSNFWKQFFKPLYIYVPTIVHCHRRNRWRLYHCSTVIQLIIRYLDQIQQSNTSPADIQQSEDFTIGIKACTNVLRSQKPCRLQQAEQGSSIITKLWFMPFLQVIDSCAVRVERVKLQSSGKTNPDELWEIQ